MKKLISLLLLSSLLISCEEFTSDGTTSKMEQISFITDRATAVDKLSDLLKVDSRDIAINYGYQGNGSEKDYTIIVLIKNKKELLQDADKARTTAQKINELIQEEIENYKSYGLLLCKFQTTEMINNDTIEKLLTVQIEIED